MLNEQQLKIAGINESQPGKLSKAEMKTIVDSISIYNLIDDNWETALDDAGLNIEDVSQSDQNTIYRMILKDLQRSI